MEVNTAFVIHKLSREATTGPRRTLGQGDSGQEPPDKVSPGREAPGRVTPGREPRDRVAPGREVLDRVTLGKEPRLVRMGAGMAQGPMEIAEHHQQDFLAPTSSSPGNTARPPECGLACPPAPPLTSSACFLLQEPLPR